MGSSPAERYAAARALAKHEATRLARFEAQYDFPLDDFQLEGCRALEAGKSVLVAAPTGAGKTVVGEFAVYLGLMSGRKTFYTTPIKALSNQKYLDLVTRYGHDVVGLLTGDNSINPHAPIVVMTTEVLRNMLYAGSADLENLAYVVMDEVHYLADRFRGPVWEESIIHLDASVQVVALSATVSNAEEFGQWLEEVRGHCQVIVSEHRPVPLKQFMMVGRKLFPLYSHEDADSGGVINRDLTSALHRARRAQGGYKRPPRPGRFPAPPSLTPPRRSVVIEALHKAHMLPAIVFVFSRNGCEEAVSQAMNAGINLTTAEEAQQIRRIIQANTAQLSGADLAAVGFHSWASALEHGIAAHHAGMLTAFKETVEQLFTQGLVKVVYATETLALGVNMPARTVVLESLRKWDGQAHNQLTPGQYTQLTGRAGRRGIDSIGYAVVLGAGQVEAQTVASLASKRSYPLKSAFTPNYNMAVNLLSRTNYNVARDILESSFAQFQADRAVVELAASARKARAKADNFSSQMRCSHGDYPSYARLLLDISAGDKELKQLISADETRYLTSQMRALKRGDVILLRVGRRSRHAVVLEQRQDAAGLPLLSIVDETAKVQVLTPLELKGPAVVLGKIQLGHSVGARNHSALKKTAARLSQMVAGGDLKPAKLRAKQSVRTKQLRARLDQLRSQLREHPCHSCPHREEHAVVGRKWAKAQREADRISARVHARTSSIARTFEAVCKVLEHFGYLEREADQLRPTARGKLLARIYAERDLLVAQCLVNGVWANLSPAQLAGVASSCVFEPRIGSKVAFSDGTLGKALRKTTDQAEQIHLQELAVELARSGDAQWDLAEAINAWVSGADLKDVLALSELGAGDFVRWCKQLLDLVRQLRSLALDGQLETIAVTDLVRLEAGLNRGVVAWSNV